MQETLNTQIVSGDLVSIIVPVYNSEKYIHRCLESLIHQSYKNIEIILVNDGSIDDSEFVCRNYALTDNRIKVISQENKGPAAARNTGIYHAVGDFVFFLDADDFIEIETIEILITIGNEYHSDLVMANFSKLINDNEFVNQSVTFYPDAEPFQGKIKQLSKTEIASYVRHFLRHPSNHLVSYCWARLYKLSIIKTYGIYAHEDMRLFEDYVFNLEYLKHINEIIFVNKPLYVYVMHDSHISASMAIFDGDSLLHDMSVFKENSIEYFQQTNFDIMKRFNINQEIGHALIHYVIIFLIRSCRQITASNKKAIYREVSKVINAPILKDSLQYYSPLKGNSRILPWLMKFRLIHLIMLICKYKAYKRYGRPKNKIC